MLSFLVPHTLRISTLLEFVDLLALAWLILTSWVPFFWLLIHPAVRFWRRFGNRAFWVALPVWLAFAAAFILLRHQLFADRIARSAPTWALGVSLFALSGWVERQSRRALGVRRLVGIPEMNPGHRLSGVVCSGIYSRVRHPRYVEYMLTVLSMAFLTGALPIFLLAILNILLYQIVAPLEERELLDHYGAQYASYRREVPRFVPRWWRRTKPQPSS
jgi:protein-S-isoprenylcysteine O-methyltransferase Ste14